MDKEGVLSKELIRNFFHKTIFIGDCQLIETKTIGRNGSILMNAPIKKTQTNWWGEEGRHVSGLK